MGGLALLARQLGHKVSGSDQNVYPPMGTQLEEVGILLQKGYAPENLDPPPDMAIIGNALSRGNPEVEAVLNLGLPYVSGPQWLAEFVLQGRWVLAVAGTHGKTTTSSMLAWILEQAGLEPGFLIGGIPLNFGISARLGGSSYFVVEADEYDTAFFDKRSKFVHYRPRTAVLNNLEYDHADIFPDLAAIQRQFHHFVRTIPGEGRIIAPRQDENLAEVLRLGCWTPVEWTALGDSAKDSRWRAQIQSPDASRFMVFHQEKPQGAVTWALSGKHNAANALSAIAAAYHIGIEPGQAIQALKAFKNVRRRLEVRACINGITLYDDFAHHPTAIAATLEGLRGRVKRERIIAIVEPRSNTMRLGLHQDSLAHALEAADMAFIYRPEGLDWDVHQLSVQVGHIGVFDTLESIIEQLCREARCGDHLIFMSNGSFGGIHERAAEALKQRNS